MENRLFDDAAITQVLDDDSLEKLRRDTGIPDRIRIHDDDGAAGANSEARRFPPFDPRWAEQEALALQQRRQHRVQIPTSPVRGAETARADEDVAGIVLHEWFSLHRRIS
jgi:hypothetical protein